MIRIFDKEEKAFTSLGLGSLDESLAAIVGEEINGAYELELQYPLNGRHFDKIKHQNIIFCKPNPYHENQPFRIYAITRPMDGKIIVNAEHISYDANYVTILPKRNENKEIVSYGTKVEHIVEGVAKNGYFLDSVISDINSANVLKLKNRFTIHRDISKENTFSEDGFKIEMPMPIRTMLGGVENSLLAKYKGELLFDKFDIYLKNRRGSNRGLSIRYGKNMTELEHESDGNGLYTSIFPFYSKSYSESYTSTEAKFQDAYCVNNITPLRGDWLSVDVVDIPSGIGGIAMKPIVDMVEVFIEGVGSQLVKKFTSVRVKTPGEYEDKIFLFDTASYGVDQNGELTGEPITKVDVHQVVSHIDETTEALIIDEFRDINGVTIVPSFGIVYKIKEDGNGLLNKEYIFDKNSYVEYTHGGFYKEAFDYKLAEHEITKPLPTYPITYSTVESKWLKDYVNGKIYVEARFPNISTVTVDKYVYSDLIDFQIPEGSMSTAILEDGMIFVNEELKLKQNQRVLTLDLTSDIDDIPNIKPTDVTKEMIFNKAEQYLKDNDLTKIKENIVVSFIDISNSEEYKHLKSLEVVELGDDVLVEYEKLGIKTTRRVISTKYNVLSNSYDEIELGEESSKITNNIVTNGDNVSKLTNDSEYTNKTYVVEFVAENAKIINAVIQNAIIETLQAANVNISGLLQASWATIDKLVAQMLTATDAEITNMLKAGSVVVSGNITALSGEIGGSKIRDGKLELSTSIKIVSEDGSTHFEVDKDGNVKSNSVDIEGGSITIGGTETEPNFVVNNKGEISVKGLFTVDEFGVVKANSIEIDSATVDNINARKIDAVDLTVQEIKFGDDNVILKRETESISETQFVTFTPSVIGVYDEISGRFNIQVKVTSDKAVWVSRSIRVSYSYYLVSDPNMVLTYRSDYVDISVGSLVSDILNVMIITNEQAAISAKKNVFPSSVNEIRQLGNTNKLVAIINGVTFNVVDEQSGGYVGIKILVQDAQPDVSEVNVNDWWYDTSE